MDAQKCQYSFPVDEAVKKWRTLVANDGRLLEEEFHALRRMDPTRITIGTNPLNKSKNRYASIHPYDEDYCRVCLKKEVNDPSTECSDYINASMIRCIPPNEISPASTSRVFYAAQGPSERTLDDFVRMIVEQQISVIVMLSYTYDPITCTYAQEHASYFPETVKAVIETKLYKIRTEAIIPAYRFIGRRLYIKSKITNTRYFCEQLHYPHFMDKGIPSDCHSMIGLVMRLRESNNRNQRILVHCSAGIGRTGVFIALYYLMEAFKQRQVLNVKRLVDTIRLYRAHLVQTVEQYEFIYRCLAEVAIHPCDGRSLDEFIEYYNKFQPTIHSKENTIYQDYEHRNNRIELDSYVTKIVAGQHPQCNRNKLFVPYDYNRVILHSPSESMYINASHITNLIGPKGTILTQEPMKSTLQPFFSMLLQEHKTFIVAVEQMGNPSYAEVEFVSSSEINVDVSTVNPSKNKFGDYFRSHKIRIRYNTVRDSDVFIFEYTGEWRDDGSYLPKNLEQFVRFVDRAIYHQRKHDPTRLGLVVHDRDGGAKAGFYCIVQNLLDRLLIDGRVAMENCVSSICQQRMNALMPLEQYIALHQIVCIWNHLNHRGALECTGNKERI